MKFFNSIYSLFTLQQNKGNCLTVNMNENKTQVITQFIPRYTSEYYGNLDYNIPQVRTNRGTGLEMLLGLNQVILSFELGEDGYRGFQNFVKIRGSRHIKF